MRILLVEDDLTIARPILEDLRHQHHSVDHATDGLAGLAMAQAAPFDLILLDVMLPKLDGFSVCRQLRSEAVSAYILMITARDATPDKVAGLDGGADDYLVKPFDLDELGARIRALARRTIDVRSSALTHGSLCLDSARHRVTVGGSPVSLTPREFMLLEQFLACPERVFTRSDLMDKLWDLDQVSGEETIKTHITNLRRKLRLASQRDGWIETVYGVGYRLSPQPPA